MTPPKLRCCRPTGAWGQGVSLMHGALCYKAGRPLNDDEYAEWRSKIDHPARYVGGRTVAAMPVVGRPTRPHRERRVRLQYCTCHSPTIPCSVHREADLYG